MKVCDLSSGMGRVSQAFSKLKEQWSTAKELWRDESSRKFQDTFLQPLPAKMQQFVAALQRLQGVLREAEQELEDRPESL